MTAAPLQGLRALMVLARGRAAFKARVAAAVIMDPAGMPFNRELLDLLGAERAKGRKIYLASASDRRCVEAVAAHLGLFDGIFSSDGGVNLGGRAKATALCKVFGEGGFDYIGNCRADLAVWEKANRALVVEPQSGLLRQIRRRFPEAQAIGARKPALKEYLRALRVHQWLKNFLIFIPALAAHRTGTGTLAALALAFTSFSLAASSTYLLNDLIDLRNDRDHPTKRNRPFASGSVPLLSGVLLVPGLLLAAAGFAAFLPGRFIALLVGYYALTLAYSLRLKRVMTADVLILACLYGMRLVAGGAAVAVPLSPWLVAFSTFLFLSLAIVKRTTELIARGKAGKGDPGGRGYQLRDLPVLEAMAAASGYVAVMVFALYINSPMVAGLYRNPDRLWFICIVLLYWLSRIFILTRRGEMDDDPLVFAATDRTSLLCAAVMAGVIVASI